MNLAQEHVELVRRGYAAFNTADMATLMELFDEDASWHTPGRGPLAGDHKGREAVFTQFGRYGAETAGTFQAILQNVVSAEDGTVVGIHHNTGDRKGRQLDVDCCIVFEFSNGKVIRGSEHFYNLYAWDEFWS